jgi:glutamate--cysteine ligase
MSRDQAQDQRPIESTQQLVEWFTSASKGTATLGVGTEHEKLGFDAGTLKPLSYEGPSGIGRLLEELVSRFGWEPQFDEGRVMALLKGDAAVTLEPGGQFELSGRVTKTVFETRDELASHLSEVAEIGADLNQLWTHLALNPWDQPADVAWMPKSRYVPMRRYLEGQGGFAHWMMKMTATVQANFDYRDERDALRKLAFCSRANPIVTSLFATSPYRGGVDSGFVSERMHIWEDTDADRCGTPAVYLDPEAGFAEVVEWALDVPIVFLVRDGRYLDFAGTPFRHVLEGRVDGIQATMGDWELHLSAIFPDVRIKQYIEVRTADAGLPDQMLALPALWKGLIYDEDALRSAEALVEMTGAEVYAAARSAARRGLGGEFASAAMSEAAAELIRISRRGLDAQASVGGPSESVFLDVLLNESGQPHAPETEFRRVWEATEGDRESVMQAYALRLPS